MVPDEWTPAAIGAETLLCWTPTREASGAAHNALGFLREANNVTILTVDRESRYAATIQMEGHEVAKMLDRHGAKTNVRHVGLTEATVGAHILKEAETGGVDLIVMGAFGHSRLHDILYSDPTREIIERAKVPVLLST